MANSRIQINMGVSLFSKLTVPRTIQVPTASGIMIPKLVTENEEELPQLAIEFKQWPIPEEELKRALMNLCVAVAEQLGKKGLLK